MVEGGREMMRTATKAGARRFVLLVAVLAVCISGVALAKPGKKARDTSGVIYAGITHIEGDNLYVSGDFKDKLLGRGAIVYVVNVSAGDPGSLLLTAKRITIYTRRGSLRGKGQATETINLDGTHTISDGSFNLRRGTGAYKGHRLKGSFDGLFEDGAYTFDYVGKYR